MERSEGYHIVMKEVRGRIWMESEDGSAVAGARGRDGYALRPRCAWIAVRVAVAATDRAQLEGTHLVIGVVKLTAERYLKRQNDAHLRSLNASSDALALPVRQLAVLA